MSRNCRQRRDPQAVVCAPTSKGEAAFERGRPQLLDAKMRLDVSLLLLLNIPFLSDLAIS